MFNLRQLKKSLLGPSFSLKQLQAQLDSVSIPFTEADCRSCPDPCDKGHESYPNRFGVDMESVMLGSVKPYGRQIVISTGKMDWDREVTSTKNSLAAHVQQIMNGAPSLTLESKSKQAIQIAGVFNSSDSTKVSILNGSHHSLSENPDHDTVLVFPDYKLVTEIPRTLDGAKSLWDSALSNVSSRRPVGDIRSLSSWIIPYSCVILLCSHKRRDNKCHIASAKLGQAFTQCLEHRGWTVDTEINEYSLHSVGSPLEESSGTENEKEEHIAKQLQELVSEKKVLILRNSHTGGHRYAGNCIIYTPQGVGVWYGRVSTHEVETIVSKTLEEGLILPPLLRGGVNISRPGCKSLHDW
ncbi:Sucrase/ferredoxin-like-domain-containing protein [Rhodocollybia butyracea]|uniref:Sucrase/ferredoxin-like-domain-containing protein n=1 Tax=Rhodocollybia butyracea TaxID=206335 RepID=A0A9P5Q7T6_9AGAR|nr:Sucrase/ferredoxin-like-domain-containing protein [Rhodocollybia butyracea]